MLYFKDLVFNNNIFVRIFCILCTYDVYNIIDKH